MSHVTCGVYFTCPVREGYSFEEKFVLHEYFFICCLRTVGQQSVRRQGTLRVSHCSAVGLSSQDL